MKRLHQAILILSTIAISWYGMMVVHELGHVIGAWASGGVVQRVCLHPLHFSETVLSSNPHPLWQTWAGPMFGVILPLIAWGIARALKRHWAYLLRYFAGFCLLANGAYLGFGAFDDVADAGMLLLEGASKWQLWLFGIVCVPSAFLLWHRQGPHFGLGKAHGRVNVHHAYAVLILLVILLTTEILLTTI